MTFVFQGKAKGKRQKAKGQSLSLLPCPARTAVLSWLGPKKVPKKPPFPWFTRQVLTAKNLIWSGRLHIMKSVVFAIPFGTGLCRLIRVPPPKPPSPLSQLLRLVRF